MTSTVDALYPLTPLQAGMLFHSLAEPHSGVYIEQFSFTLPKDMDLNAFWAAWETLFQRHDVFRTFFVRMDTEKPIQVVTSKVTLPREEEDWRHLKPAAQKAKLETLLKEDRARGFDIGKAPLMRFRLLRLSDEETYFIWTHHHVLLDGWSLPIVFGELFASYDAHKAGRQPVLPQPVPLKNYIEWLGNQNREEARIWWQQELAGFTSPTPLMIDSGTDQPAGKVYHVETLPMAFQRQASETVRRHNLTLNVLCHAAWALLLKQYSGEKDILFGTVVSGRPPEIAGVERMVGPLINAVPVRLRVNPSLGVGSWLSRLHEKQIQRDQHAHLPLTEIQAVSEVDNGVSLFDSIIVLENYPDLEAMESAVSQGPFQLSDLRIVEETNYPVSIMLIPGEPFKIRASYEASIFNAEKVARMMRHYAHHLAQVVHHAHLPIHGLAPLPAEEIQQILETFAVTRGPEPTHTHFPGLFEHGSQNQADAIAVWSETGLVTYDALHRASNRLAHYLRSQNIRRGSRVGVCLNRCPDLVLSMLAIMKAGAAYLSIDPAYPDKRVAYLIEDSGIQLLIGDSSFGERQTGTACPMLMVQDRGNWGNQPDTFEVGPLGPEDVAYLIYTSGSTGLPKGSANIHRGMVNMAAYQRTELGAGAGDRVLQFAALSFDATLWEMSMALGTGAALVLMSRDRLMPGPDLAGTLLKYAVTHVTLPPSTLALTSSEGLGRTRTVVSAGEACTHAVLRQWAAGRQFVNAYGPSETTVCALMGACREDWKEAPIGKPVPHAGAYILDAELRPVPIGINGQLCIAGKCVSQGYLHRPALTAARFVPNPFGDGDRLYLTGDQARWREDGRVVYVGRSDHQAKVRGFRIEPGEIEAVLAQSPFVRDCAVVIRNDVGQGQIAAFLVAREGGEDGTRNQQLQVDDWQNVYDDNYQQYQTESDPLLNFEGWVSNFTDTAIPIREMTLWADDTARRIIDLKPDRILEIGCGSGLLLFRIAPHVSHYHGLDFSQPAIDYARANLHRLGDTAVQVVLEQGQAHALDAVEDGAYDLVIINSVAQYFPSLDYLLDVMGKAHRKLTDTGKLFLGDIRNAALHRMFATAVEVYHAKPSMTVESLAGQIQRRLDQEPELLVDPGLFPRLVRQGSWKEARMIPKTFSYDNELSRYRYDVVLAKTSARLSEPPVSFVSWNDLGDDPAAWLASRSQESEASLLIHGIPMPLLAKDRLALDLIANAPPKTTIAQLNFSVDADALAGRESQVEALSRKAAELGRRVLPLLTGRNGPETYDLWLRPQDEAAYVPVSLYLDEERPLPTYANHPIQQTNQQRLGGEIKQFAVDHLPAHMVPNTYHFLSQFPITPNGKVDKKALLELEIAQDTPELYVAPKNKMEQILADLWQTVLDVRRIGVNDDFFELGGHSLSALKLITEINKSLDLKLPVRVLFENPTISQLAALISGDQPQQEAFQFLEAEVVLEPEIAPAQPAASPAWNHILLTGSTGFLGVYLLHDLLKHTHAKLYCIVRAKDGRDAWKRTEQNLAKYQLWDPAFATRIEALAGDLGKPQLGLTKSQFQFLASRIDVIFHNGALVNFVFPYQGLKKPNVESTRELIRMACTAPTKPIHYISTAGVLNYAKSPILEEFAIPLHPFAVGGGYEQTKWVSERLLALAHERGVPVAIYRPSRIGADSRTGNCNLEEWFCRMIKGAVDLGKVPERLGTDNMLPVDFVSRAIVHIALQENVHGRAYHLVNPENYAIGLVVEALRARGYILDTVTYREWYAQLEEAIRHNSENPLGTLFPLLPKEEEELLRLQNLPPIDCQNTVSFLKASGLTIPAISKELLNTQIEYFEKVRYI